MFFTVCLQCFCAEIYDNSVTYFFLCMILKVKPGNKNRSVEQFEEFYNALMPIVEKAKNARLMAHVR